MVHKLLDFWVPKPWFRRNHSLAPLPCMLSQCSLTLFNLMGQAASRVGNAGDAAVGRASAGGGHSRIKAGAAYALSSPSATRGSEGRQAQPAPDTIAIIAASTRQRRGRRDAGEIKVGQG